MKPTMAARWPCRLTDSTYLNNGALAFLPLSQQITPSKYQWYKPILKLFLGILSLTISVMVEIK